MITKGGGRLSTARLNVIGALGALDRADQQGLVEDFLGLLERLETAGFRMEASLKALLQQRHRQRRNG
jgi:predicted nucleic acid-binding protein